MSNEELHSAPVSPGEREHSGRARMRAVQVGFLLLFGAVIFRLVRIQVIDAGTK